MDRFTVFCRTDAGERELAEPKTSADKLSRSVLEMVDGFSTVGELSSRLGRNRAVQQALSDLERMNLVETLDARMARVAEQESRWLRGDTGGSDRVEPSASPASMGSETRAEARMRRNLASGSRATLFDRVRAFIGNFGRGAGEGSRKLRKVFVWMILLALLGGVGAAGGVVAMQVSKLRGKVELEAAQWLGEPVRVGAVKLGFHPWPAFSLSDIQIGEGGTSRIDRAWAYPDWWRWAMGGTQRLHITVDGLVMQPALAQRIAVLEAPGKGWRLAEVSVEQGTLPLGKLRIDGLSGNLQFSNDGRWEFARLRQADFPLVYELAVRDRQVKVSSHASTFQFGETKLENLLVSGDLSGAVLRNVQISANWLGGALKGSGELDFTQGLRFDGQVRFDSLNGRDVALLSGSGALFDGRLSGLATVHGDVPLAASLPQSLDAKGEFGIAEGSLNGVDLIEAMRRDGSGKISGGATRFATAAGQFVYEPGKPLRVDIKRMQSGALTASGRIFLDRAGAKFGGTLRAQVRTPVESISRSFIFEGLPNAPNLRNQF